ncbi:MAG: hypothetical protein R3C01_09350 [Planctomycetaceae bacterium]
MFKSIIATSAVLCLIATSDAQAGGVQITFGRGGNGYYGNNYRGGHYGHGHGGYSHVGGHQSYYSTPVRSYSGYTGYRSGQPIYGVSNYNSYYRTSSIQYPTYNTGHYDYYPTQVVPHGNHYDVIPAHSHYHVGPHYSHYGY